MINYSFSCEDFTIDVSILINSSHSFIKNKYLSG